MRVHQLRAPSVADRDIQAVEIRFKLTDTHRAYLALVVTTVANTIHTRVITEIPVDRIIVAQRPESLGVQDDVYASAICASVWGGPRRATAVLTDEQVSAGVEGDLAGGLDTLAVIEGAQQREIVGRISSVIRSFSTK